MIVYAVMGRDYESSWIEAIFSTKERAEEFLLCFREGDFEVEEHIVDDPKWDVDTLKKYNGYFSKYSTTVHNPEETLVPQLEEGGFIDSVRRTEWDFNPIEGEFTIIAKTYARAQEIADKLVERILKEEGVS